MSAPGKTIYLISGLGADERAFRYLDLSRYTCRFVRWTRPLPGETLQAYTARMIQEQIPDPEPVLVGLSFGGVAAIEIAKQVPTSRVIIISSVKKRKELPWFMRAGGALHLHRLIPTQWYKTPGAIKNWFFGLKNKEQKALLAAILKDSDDAHLDWAVNEILTWQNTSVPGNLIHIHGTADRFFPGVHRSADYVVEGGGHFMVMSHSKEVSTLLQTLL